MKVLLVEDDARVAQSLRDVLGRHGFRVSVAASGEEALRMLDDETRAVVLDLGLPDLDGFEVCRRLRTTWDGALIMATARGDLASRVHGLHVGADDYLVKPFDLRELMARLHAVTRRADRRQPQETAGEPGTTIDLDRRTVTVDGRPVALTRMEFEVLAVLARAPGVVFPREQIISEVWHTRDADRGRTLEVHVASIRAKSGRPDLIQTVRGVGYRVRSPEDRAPGDPLPRDPLPRDPLPRDPLPHDPGSVRWGA